MASTPEQDCLLQPALDRALAAFPQDTARRAAGALRTMLHDRIAADGECAWSSTRLTGDGFPVELTFTTADNRLRYTVEPASAELAPQRRLDAALRVLDSLGPGRVPEEVVATLRGKQSRGLLLFGAWLAGRHGPDGDEFKIYVEAPDAVRPDDGDGTMPVDGVQPLLADRGVRLRMIAYSPTSQQWEAYYRIKSMAPYHIPGVLAPCGLASRAEELVDFLTEAYGHSLREKLPGESVGVSYSLRSPEQPASVTLFFFARVLWGGDARIRQRFGHFARALGWDDSRYQRITADLALRRSWRTYHGILGITITRDGHMALSIGVRPPEAAQ